MKLRALIIIIVLFLGVFAWWAWPKSHTLSCSPYHTSHYRGFGLPGAEDPVLGKKYYRVTFAYEDTRLEVEYKGPRYNNFKRFYPDGTLAEEGKCMVELYDLPLQPVPDESNLLWSKCYKPDGTLCSEVENGTGIQTYWTPQGVKIWELELVDFERARHSMWYPNGQIHETQAYVGGLVNGSFVSYYPSGAKKTEGAYSKGDRVGKWIWYNGDGGISKTENYTTPSKKPAEMPAD
jgi:hypothetical protein